MEIKSLYDISWKVSEEEYRADPAYSYSTISKFNREGFNNLDKLFDKLDTPSLLFGSMVDTLLTDGQEEFNKRFLVAEFPSLPDTIIKIVKSLFTEFQYECRSIKNIPDEVIIEFAGKFDYQNNWKPETRAKVIKEKGEEYYNLLYLSSDKVIVTTEDYNTALDCVSVLRNHTMSKWYFQPNNPFDTNIERLYQLKFKGNWEGINLRCMADLILVNHERKEIIPCDLKTSYKKEWEFHKSFIDWGYWIQAQLYWYIIRQNLDNDEQFKDYKLLNYRFIVISKGSQKPLVWKYPDTKAIKDLTYGKNNQFMCKNWRSIVKELDYYLTNRPEYPIGINSINNINDWLNNE